MKKWYKSKTIILNIIALMLGLIPMIDVDFLTAFGVTNVQIYLTVLGFVAGFLNLVLRMITTQPITTKKSYARDEDIGGGGIKNPPKP